MLMPTVFTWLLRYIGWPGILLCAFYVYEEGIPGAHRIPFLSSIPIVGDLTTGRVHSYAAEQVRIATAQQQARFDAKLEKMVSVFERDTLAAQLAEERRRVVAATKVADEFRTRYAAQLEVNKRNREKAEKDIADDNQTDDGARVGRGDLDWLSKH